MANELTVMSSAAASTATQHGGQQAAMSISAPVVAGREGMPIEPSDKALTSLTETKVMAAADKEQFEKQAQELQARELQERLASLSDAKGWTIQFSLGPEFDEPVIKVVDADTKQVIRQIPSEEMLVLNKRLQELGQAKGSGISLRGLLFDEQA